LDNILKVIYDHAEKSVDGTGKSLIFSSTNPYVCTSLNWKQPNYGVFFKTYAGFGSDKGSSIKEGVKFAKQGNMLGIICYNLVLAWGPELVESIKRKGLILASFGEECDGGERRDVRGVDAIVRGGVFRYK
jgi:CDK inhibitor PHO81